MLAIDGILSVITWTPYMMPTLIPSSLPTDSPDSNPLIYKMIFFALMLSNCFFTPIIYMTFSKDFQVLFIELPIANY